MLRESKIVEQMELLGIKDITTDRQVRNGTVIWQLPIKMYGQYIEVGSFKSGYVRRMNGGYTPYQLNKCEPNVEYYKDFEHFQDQNGNWRSEPTGKYNKYVGKRRIIIDKEIDRLEYLITYCLKNYYIKQANQVEDGKFVTKWRHEYEMKNKGNKLQDKYDELMDRFGDLSMTHEDLVLSKNNNGNFLKCEDTDEMTHFKYSGGQIENMENGDIFVHEQHAYWNKLPSSVEVIIDGHKYKIK